jgi:hypothetical protein
VELCGYSAKGGVGVFDAGAIDMSALGALRIGLSREAVVNPMAAVLFPVVHAEDPVIAAVAFPVSFQLGKINDVIQSRIFPGLDFIAERFAVDLLNLDRLF